MQKSIKKWLSALCASKSSMHQAQTAHNWAVKHGFDWPSIPPVLAKVEEEIEELKLAFHTESAQRQQEELGDLLFTIVHLAHRLNINPDQALTQATKKFQQRFSKVEQEIKKNPQPLNLEQMEAIWKKNKQQE